MFSKKGFTLIELIMVIIVLSLIFISAPKFLNIQSDARKAQMEGLKSSFLTTIKMLNVKAEVNIIPITEGSVNFKKLYSGYIDLSGKKLYFTHRENTGGYNPVFNVGFAGSSANKNISDLLSVFMNIDIKPLEDVMDSDGGFLVSESGSDGIDIYSSKGFDLECVLHYEANKREPVTLITSGC
ncbi:type II secretion system protein [Vibrio harveyi]|uniref:type II secretion system protein n=1 Tax=Vibrio harveyi TaxID=669 RepID=UPI0023D86DB6|nr:type II secretion system protein [Vibrio harveyi]